MASSASKTWDEGQENVRSVELFSEIFCMIISTFIPDSDSGPKIAAATPGLSSTPVKVIFASSFEQEIPDIFCFLTFCPLYTLVCHFFPQNYLKLVNGHHSALQALQTLCVKLFAPREDNSSISS